jgi:hypothetical protein
MRRLLASLVSEAPNRLLAQDELIQIRGGAPSDPQ